MNSRINRLRTEANDMKSADSVVVDRVVPVGDYVADDEIKSSKRKRRQEREFTPRIKDKEFVNANAPGSSRDFVT